MSRIPGTNPNDLPQNDRERFQDQEAAWGTHLSPYLLYARRPPILRAVGHMWDALAESALLPGELTSLICRRVANLNGCVF